MVVEQLTQSARRGEPDVADDPQPDPCRSERTDRVADPRAEQEVVRLTGTAERVDEVVELSIGERKTEAPRPDIAARSPAYCSFRFQADSCSAHSASNTASTRPSGTSWPQPASNSAHAPVRHTAGSARVRTIVFQ